MTPEERQDWLDRWKLIDPQLDNLYEFGTKNKTLIGTILHEGRGEAMKAGSNYLPETSKNTAAHILAVFVMMGEYIINPD